MAIRSASEVAIEIASGYEFALEKADIITADRLALVARLRELNVNSSYVEVLADCLEGEIEDAAGKEGAK